MIKIDEGIEEIGQAFSPADGSTIHAFEYDADAIQRNVGRRLEWPMFVFIHGSGFERRDTSGTTLVLSLPEVYASMMLMQAIIEKHQRTMAVGLAMEGDYAEAAEKVAGNGGPAEAVTTEELTALSKGLGDGTCGPNCTHGVRQKTTKDGVPFIFRNAKKGDH